MSESTKDTIPANPKITPTPPTASVSKNPTTSTPSLSTAPWAIEAEITKIPTADSNRTNEQPNKNRQNLLGVIRKKHIAQTNVVDSIPHSDSITDIFLTTDYAGTCYTFFDMAVLLDTVEDIITVNEAGVWRLAGTRVSVDSVIYSFNSGASPEEIVWQFDTLDLKKVYALINYYLHNREHVDKYLAAGEKEANRIGRKLEKEFPLPAGLKERINARRRELG